MKRSDARAYVAIIALVIVSATAYGLIGSSAGALNNEITPPPATPTDTPRPTPVTPTMTPTPHAVYMPAVMRGWTGPTSIPTLTPTVRPTRTMTPTGAG